MPADVQAAVQRGDRKAAVRIALRRWRKNRAPYISDAIAALSDGETFEPPKAKDFQTAWLQVARRSKDPIAVRWLVDNLESNLRTDARRVGGRVTTDLSERISALAVVPPDPRIATALIAILSRPADSPTAMKWTTFKPLLQAIVAHADVGHVEQLRGLARRPGGLDKRVKKAVDTLLPEYTDRLLDLVPAPAGEEEAWRSIAATEPQTPADTPERLLAAIYADPGDDESRLVYADLLQTNGDPHGEFIALQMMPPERLDDDAIERVRRLQHRHATEWLGPDLSTVLGNFVFERGFLAAATVVYQSNRDAAVVWLAAKDERLSTLHTLRIARGAERHATAFLKSSALRSLRCLEIEGPEAIDTLRALDEPTQVLHVRVDFRAPEHWIEELTALPALDDVGSLEIEGRFRRRARPTARRHGR